MTINPKPYLAQTMQVDVPEHNVLFSFNDDSDAAEFRNWWYYEGEELWEGWSTD